MKKKRSGRTKLLAIIAVLMLCGALIFAFLWLKPFKPAPAKPPATQATVRGKIPTPPPLPVQQTNGDDEQADTPPQSMDALRDQAADLTATPAAPEKNSMDASPTPLASAPTSPTPTALAGKGYSDSTTSVVIPSPERPQASREMHNYGPASEVDTPHRPDATQEIPRPAANTVESPAPEPPKRSYFTIQVGAFREKAYAQQSLAQWQDRGYGPYILETVDARERPWYFVRFGQFDNREEAILSLAGFQTKEKASAIIAEYKAP